MQQGPEYMGEPDVRVRRGAALRAARRQAHLSARELADRVNSRCGEPSLTDHAIYSYERGKVLLAAPVARRLAEVLRVPLCELLVGDPEFDAAAAPGTYLAGDRFRAAPPAGWSAGSFGWGVVVATAEDLVDGARMVCRAAAALAADLRVVYDPAVKARDFASAFGGLLKRLAFLAESGDARRVERDPTRYEDVADLVAQLQQLRASLERWWQNLIRLTSRPGGDQAEALSACRQIAADLERLDADIRDCAGRCEQFIHRRSAAAVGGAGGPVAPRDAE